MILVITSSPNADGLTAACGKAALRGVERGGKTGEIVDLCREKIQACLVCNDGWGLCREERRCVIEDRFADLRRRVEEAEALILVTPVYWGQQSERMKYFCDRLRRCEGFKRDRGILAGKRVNLVAAAGGSGNGTVSCLTDMELWCRHLFAVPFIRQGVTRFDREPMLAAIEQAAFSLTQAPA